MPRYLSVEDFSVGMPNHEEDVKRTQEKSQAQTRLQLLTAPVDGTVQPLAMHTVAGVVTPAQSSARLVPANSLSLLKKLWKHRESRNFL